MISKGPVETYLSELHRRLPYPAPRLIGETREHLMEATSASLAGGLTQEEAERRAVESYGPVDEVVAAVLAEGSALMSPLIVRLLVPFAILLSLPTFVFVFVNLIEEAAGSGGSVGVFGSPVESWGNTVNGLIAFGPFIALLLIVLSSVRVHRDRGVHGFAATIELKMSRAVMWAALVVTLVAGSIFAYGLADNYGNWRDFHNMNWTCTNDDQGRQVCYQGSLGPEQIPDNNP